MVQYVAKHRLFVTTLLTTLALSIAAFVIPVLAMTDPATRKVHPVGGVLGLVLFPMVFVGGFTVMERARRLVQVEIESELSARYGVSVRQERPHSPVWIIAGEPRQAILTDAGALLVGGSELPRVAS